MNDQESNYWKQNPGDPIHEWQLLFMIPSAAVT